MLELNDVALETVSGGWGFKKTTIINKNYSNLSIKHVDLGKGSTLAVFVTQSIG